MENKESKVNAIAYSSDLMQPESEEMKETLDKSKKKYKTSGYKRKDSSDRSMRFG